MTEQQFITKTTTITSTIWNLCAKFYDRWYLLDLIQIYYIRRSHSILIWLNLLFLFFITLISFATYLDFKYGNFHKYLFCMLQSLP
jgi:hypothetical protein